MGIGDTIRELRARKRLTQAGLARQLNVTRWGDEGKRTGTATAHYVYRWEKGIRHPEDWLPYLEQVLGADLSGYGESPVLDADVLDMEGLVPPVDRRVFLGAGAVAGIALSAPSAMAKGRRIGSSDIVRAGQRLAALRRLDDYSGGVSVYPKVVAEIESLAGMAAHGSYSDAVARDLLSALAELYQFASWTAFDAGRIPQARRYAQAAASAANQAGNTTLGSTALSELSYLTASTSKGREAVDMARASIANAPRDALPAVSVVLSDRLAWACARVGDTSGVDRALGLSEAAHDRRDTARVEEPDSVYWINRDETQIMAGRCWAELHQPKKAVPILEGLTAPYDDTHAREVGLYACWLAGSYLDAGALDEATDSAQRAATLSFHTASPRLNEWVDGTLTRFRPHQDHAGVRELLDAYQS
ncbi:helix-turn-helix transcriptional regulator [Streptomyces sp. UNOC14_S4]|uniref:helix-turn-helix transcriptional regulator n=1 Tax=Streptomyces sp. UNOC14_S4 TaxID=2872340 RepID=UPI001E294B0B|nr:helix-turn-helix transcriptional regulator [Streptomyces sp. UNOC14_S4]MCC3769913.1 helix-turn-helix domain-containing protein [Streptomyces sp. UNOC14_S4]